MRIRLKTLMAGPDGVKPAGSVVELPDDQARRLIDSGQAEEIKAEALPSSSGRLPGEQEAVSRETAISRAAKGREKRGAKTGDAAGE